MNNSIRKMGIIAIFSFAFSVVSFSAYADETQNYAYNQLSNFNSGRMCDKLASKIRRLAAPDRLKPESIRRMQIDRYVKVAEQNGCV